MLRKILLIAVASLFVFGMSKLSFAMMCGDHSGSQQLAQAHTEHEHGVAETSKATVSEKAVNPVRNQHKSLLNVSNGVNVGNKICPGSGEKIEEKTKATYEYKGKIYNFCCASCIPEFKKDPEKYIKKVEEELQAESKGQATHEGHEMEMMQEPETMHQGHHH